MRLYHGSYTDIKRIDLSKSKPNKDFGKGFYLSADYQQALELATFKAKIMNSKPVVSCFEFDESLLAGEKLKTKVFDSYSEEWAEFVFANRNFTENGSAHDYDIVVGPIANDRVGVQIRRYFEREITLETFLERLKYMKGVTTQYFFGTEAAIGELHKVEEN